MRWHSVLINMSRQLSNLKLHFNSVQVKWLKSWFDLYWWKSGIILLSSWGSFSFTLRWQKLALFAFSFIVELKLKLKNIFGASFNPWKSSFSVATEDDILHQTIRWIQSRCINENFGLLPAALSESCVSFSAQFYALVPGISVGELQVFIVVIVQVLSTRKSLWSLAVLKSFPSLIILSGVAA